MNKYLLFIVLSLSFCPGIMAQAPDKPTMEIPVILARLATGKPDTTRVLLLWQLGHDYDIKPGEEKIDMDSAAYFFTAAITLADSLKYLRGQLQVLNNLGKFYLDRNKFKEARPFFLRFISLAKTADPELQAAWLHDAGTYAVQYKDSVFPEKNWCLQRALVIYKQLNNRMEQARVLKDMGDAHLNEGNLNLADSELLQAVAIFKSLGETHLHFSYDLLSATARNGGRLNQALYYALEAVRSMEATGDTLYASSFYQKVADVNHDLGRPAESILWYKKSTDAFLRSFGAPEYYNMATLAIEMVSGGRVQEALDMLEKMVRDYGNGNDDDRLAVARAMGACYTALKKYDLAEKYYLEMIKRAKIMARKFEAGSEYYRAIAQFYVDRHQYEKARPYIVEAMSLAPGVAPLSDQATLHLLLFKVDSASGGLDSAIRHYEQYKTLSDSMLNIARSRQIEELQILYKTEKREQDLAILRTQSQLQEKALASSAQLRNFTFAGILMLLIMLGLVFNRYRLKQRSNRLLQIQQQEINVKNQHLEHMVEEKEWLLREIHHRVKNNLQVIISLLNTQSAFINNEAALAAIRESRHRMQAMSLIHQKLYQLDNVAVIDMTTYIPELLSYLKESFNITRQLQFSLEVDPISLDLAQAIPVALILNETITNALKHAFPDKKPGDGIRVSLRHAGEKKILLSITDNGKGFANDHQPDPNASFGMNLISILSQQLEGELTILHEGGIGMHILFTPVLSSLPVM